MALHFFQYSFLMFTLYDFGMKCDALGKFHEIYPFNLFFNTHIELQY